MEMDPERYAFINSSIGKGTTIVTILAGVSLSLTSMHDLMIQYLRHLCIFLYPWRLPCDTNECSAPCGSYSCITIQSVA
jgi:hypothetical protein